MIYALHKAESKILFTVPSSIDIAEAAAKAAGIPKERIFLLEGQLAGYKTMAELLKKGASYGESGQVAQYRLPAGKKNKDVCGFLSFSSGTTGLPKAVMIAHSNVIAQCLQIEQITPETLRRILAVLPLFHITGLVHQLHLPILLNANVYMLPTFTMDSMYKCVEEYRLEEMLLVPPILIRMTREKDLLKKYDMSSVKRFSSGAAPLSAEILEQLQQVFPGTATGAANTGFKQGYGMTESCSCITAHPPEKYNYKYAFRVGTIVASTEVKIIDPDTGKECGLNEPGEICARGPQIVMGYLNNEQATRDTFDKDGFLHTGDIGKLDEEGLISIVDRAKELIKVKGEQVNLNVIFSNLTDNHRSHQLNLKIFCLVILMYPMLQHSVFLMTILEKGQKHTLYSLKAKEISLRRQLESLSNMYKRRKFDTNGSKRLNSSMKYQRVLLERF